MSPVATTPTPTTATLLPNSNAPVATRTRHPNEPAPQGSVRVLGAQLVCKP
jgi:hypothetical protein